MWKKIPGVPGNPDTRIPGTRPTAIPALTYDPLLSLGPLTLEWDLIGNKLDGLGNLTNQTLFWYNQISSHTEALHFILISEFLILQKIA